MAGIDDSYIDHGIITRHAYDAVRRTNFYIKNNTVYCHFLEIVNDVGITL